MGLFSSFFKAVFTPVTAAVNLATTITAGATNLVDQTVSTVATALAPIPVVGTVLAEASQQVNIATDIADTAVSYAGQAVDIAQYVAADTLDLNLSGTGQDIGDLFGSTGTLTDTVFGQAGTNISSIFDFG